MSCAESQPWILKSDPDFDPNGDCMEFRLTYAGQLLGSSRNDTRPKHKHEIRKIFHSQLKRLWDITPHLKGMTDPPTEILRFPNYPKPRSRIEALAERFSRNGYSFVPLVTEDLDVSFCGIEILFMRSDPPGALIQSGDIDNRLKTIFDALRVPQSKDELGGYDTPSDGEKPFFCLLQDDKLITKVSVETDALLELPSQPLNVNDVRLIVKVTIQPRLTRLDQREMIYNFR
jgi:hypothetical protein